MSWGERQIVGGRLICDLSNDMGRVTLILFRGGSDSLEFGASPIVDIDRVMSIAIGNETV